MDEILRLLLYVLSFVVMLGAPLVAFPLALILHRGRQGIDDRINWSGENAKKLEQIEDHFTHGVVLIIANVSLLLTGAVYVWYIHTVALAVHPWLYTVIGRFPWIDVSFDFYNLGVVFYWTVLFAFAFILGWRRSNVRGHE